MIRFEPEKVDKKTSHLLAEKEKADTLVYKLLPTPIADVLKIGGPSMPEEYEHTTIYQSDIEGVIFNDIFSNRFWPRYLRKAHYRPICALIGPMFA